MAYLVALDAVVLVGEQHREEVRLLAARRRVPPLDRSDDPLRSLKVQEVRGSGERLAVQDIYVWMDR